MKIYRKQIYTYTSVKDIILKRVGKAYGYEVESLLRDLEEYYMEGERLTRIMSLDTDNKTRDTNQTGMNMIYQVEIIDYTKTSIYSKQNLRKSYTVI